MFARIARDGSNGFQALQSGDPRAILWTLEKATIITILVLSYLTFTGNLNISPTTFGIVTLGLLGVQFASRMKHLQLNGHLNHMGMFFEVIMVVTVAVQLIMMLSSRYPNVPAVASGVFSTYLAYSIIRLIFCGINYCR